MGRYIDEILQPNEKLLYSTTVHWIIYLPGLLALAVALVALIYSTHVDNNAGKLSLLALAIFSGLYGLVGVARAWFRRWTTEFDVTDRRVVHKSGFIQRRTIEMNMDKIESVDVNQTLLGRIFDYGEVVVRGVGESWEPIFTIGSPLKFRNHITAR
jgi:membrane protein YdbS with pleckstrin-like domain